MAASGRRIIQPEGDDLMQYEWEGRRQKVPRWMQAVVGTSVVLLGTAGVVGYAKSSGSREPATRQKVGQEYTILAAAGDDDDDDDDDGEATCAKYSCGGFKPKQKCQCNSECEQFDSCCPDYEKTCIEARKKDLVFDPEMMFHSAAMKKAMEKQMALASGKEDQRAEEEAHLEAAEKAMLARQKAQDTSEDDTEMPTDEKITDMREEEKKREEERAAAEGSGETPAWHETARGAFLDSLADLMGGDSPENITKLKEDAEKAVIEREEAEKKRIEEEKKKKEEEEKKKKEAIMEKKQRFEDEKHAIETWKEDEKNMRKVTLYCIALMMPFGYEPGLLYEQKKRSVGIYACDESVVFSNQTNLMSGLPSPVEVNVMNGTLAVAYGGRWMTALNTGVFNRLWMQVIHLQRYRYFDWSVKVDPDAVFFPDRLMQLLRHKEPYNKMPEIATEPDIEGKCGTCNLAEHEHETCASHVRWWQQQGKSCPDALQLTARAPPNDCGCHCDDFACDLPEAAVYLNNCKWGLHGPIEVLSRRTVATFAAGLPRCAELLTNPWGEDKFLDKCLQMLGVNRDDEYSLLSETACGEQPAPCGTSNVAFHPFKSIQSYFTCHAYANKYGDGPESIPTFEDFERLQKWEEEQEQKEQDESDD